MKERSIFNLIEEIAKMKERWILDPYYLLLIICSLFILVPCSFMLILDHRTSKQKF